MTGPVSAPVEHVGPWVLAAVDKFKGTLTAAQVAHHLAVGLRSASPDVRVRSLPVADGGEGTVAAAVAAGFRPVRVTVTGPTGEPVPADLAVRDGTAVVEMAAASGLAALPGGVPDPRGATSAGTGDLLAAALDAGCRQVVLGVGGSAGTDGGAGMLVALGARVVDRHGRPLPRGGAALAEAHAVDLSGLDPRLAEVDLVLATDVDNPLLGPEGAAAVYGPQKGASGEDVAELDRALARWAELVVRAVGPTAAGAADAAGAGAAGGVGFAALAALAARPCSGVDVVLDLVGFDDALVGVDLVVTGEGSLDEQSLHGKAPVGVARRVAARGVPVVVVAGRVALRPAELAAAGIRQAYPLTAVEPDLTRCLEQAGPVLERLGALVAADWLPAPPRPVGTPEG